MINKHKLQWGIISLITIIATIVGYNILGNYDFLKFLSWYGTLFLMTISGLPISFYVFKKFHDGGYIFSKTLGIVLSGFLMWFLSSIHILKFNIINSYICIFLVLIISLLVLYFSIRNNSKKRASLFNDIKDKIPHMIRVEIGFYLVLLLASYVKGLNPSVTYSTEQFMDYGYMAIMNKTDYMPPIDMWFSGSFMNYYYFGQYISTFITKVSQVSVNYGYNLMMTTLFAITYFIGYSICYNLLNVNKEKNNQKSKKNLISTIGGMIGGTAITIAGNMHYVLYGLILNGLQKYFTINVEHSYFYPDSTRYIGYTPDTFDKTIHEFPSYSYTVGDLHAHVINLIFTLTLVAMLFAFLLKRKEKYKEKIQDGIKISDAFHPIILLSGFLIGIFKMTNYWDYPIYFVVTGAVLLFSNILTYRKVLDIVKITALQAIVVFGMSYIVSLPFTLHFIKMASEIKFTKMRTPLFQLLVLWGLPIITIIYYFYKLIRNSKLKLKGEDSKIKKFLSIFDINDLFVIIIATCAIGLIIVPEAIYVKDIYDGGYSRANTMFKLTYQAYSLFGICFGYILIKLLINKDKLIRKKGIIFTILFALTVGYCNNCLKSGYGDVTKFSEYKTLAGMYFFNLDPITDNIPSADDRNIINWLNNNVADNSVILEAYGDSYTYANVISVFTGLATPLGWTTHEHLWRSEDSSIDFPEQVQKRMDDIDVIYTSKNKEIIEKLLRKYNISYIIISNNERKNYGDKKSYLLENEGVLNEMGKVVFKSNEKGNIVSSYIIKVDNN